MQRGRALISDDDLSLFSKVMTAMVEMGSIFSSASPSSPTASAESGLMHIVVSYYQGQGPEVYIPELYAQKPRPTQRRAAVRLKERTSRDKSK